MSSPDAPPAEPLPSVLTPVAPDESTPAEALRLLSALGRTTQGMEPAHNRRIFVNRTLRMDKIDLIGFDMDYTLALYNQPRIESLSVLCTLRKMVEKRGY